jgi:hypothetical protein
MALPLMQVQTGKKNSKIKTKCSWASDWLWNEKIKNKVIIETEPIVKSKLKCLI